MNLYSIYNKNQKEKDKFGFILIFGPISVLSGAFISSIVFEKTNYSILSLIILFVLSSVPLFFLIKQGKKVKQIENEFYDKIKLEIENSGFEFRETLSESKTGIVLMKNGIIWKVDKFEITPDSKISLTLSQKNSPTNLTI